MKKPRLLPAGAPLNIPLSGQDSILNAEFPFTKLDSTIAELTIDVITGTYPFVPQNTPNYKLMNFKAADFTDSIAYDFINRKIKFQDAHASAAERYFALNNVKSFCTEVNDMISDKPYNPEPCDYAARKLISTRHFDDAVPYLIILNKMKPSAFSAKWLGQIYLNQKNYAGALKFLSESLNFSAEDAEVWYNIAGAYYYVNKPNEALSAIKRSLELNPHNPAAEAFYKQLAQLIKKS